MAQQEFMSAREVANELGVDIRTVHRMAKDGRLTPAHQGPGLRSPLLFRTADIATLDAAEPMGRCA